MNQTTTLPRAEEEQPERGPAWPLMVWASDTLGARPEFRASFITASVSDFHHSAEMWLKADQSLEIAILQYSRHIMCLMNELRATTQDQDDFFMRGGEGIGDVEFGKDDNGAMNRSSEP
ncbi:hypothetical protein GW17_00033589 [Ensete ventricosum]|nr:hypothetical protein GW17_00033589 [Ensete ventricosum]